MPTVPLISVVLVTLFTYDAASSVSFEIPVFSIVPDALIYSGRVFARDSDLEGNGMHPVYRECCVCNIQAPHEVLDGFAQGQFSMVTPKGVG